MANTIAKWAFLVFLSSIIMNTMVVIQGQQQVPCLYFFGDSKLDNGNNNNVPRVPEVNYRPYGIDYPGGPTGRFTDGPNLADYLAKFLGFESPILPFANTTGPAIIQGLNYATGGGRVLDQFRPEKGVEIDMKFQVLNHKKTISSLGDLLINQTVDEYLKQCLYVVNIASNDYIMHFLPGSPTGNQFTPEKYADAVMQQFSRQLEELYHLNARKVAVFGVGPLGCTPQALRFYGSSKDSACVDFINNAVNLFNNRLGPAAIDKLNQDLSGAKFTYINVTSIGSVNTSELGFTVLNVPCCATTFFTGLCLENQTPCSNRNQHFFWDGFHPSSKVDQYLASKAYNTSSSYDAYPVDIRTLALGSQRRKDG